MNYLKLTNILQKANEKGSPRTGYVVISEDSFTKEYSKESRTYLFTSEEKAFNPQMGGYSIFAGSLDRSDMNIRLEQHLAFEKAGPSGWKVEEAGLVVFEVREYENGLPFSIGFFYTESEAKSKMFSLLAEKANEKVEDIKEKIRKSGEIAGYDYNSAWYHGWMCNIIPHFVKELDEPIME